MEVWAPVRLGIGAGKGRILIPRKPDQVPAAAGVGPGGVELVLAALQSSVLRRGGRLDEAGAGKGVRSRDKVDNRPLPRVRGATRPSS